LLDTLQRIMPGQLFQTLLDYQTSGDLTGDFHHSVSYAAVGYYPRSSFELSAADGAALLDSAQSTLTRFAQTREREPVRAFGSVALEARQGVFVSLQRGPELLGCIGRCAPCSLDFSALADAVPELALSAALDDPRFESGAALERPLDLEISVLTPLRRITDASAIEIGRHGAMLFVGPHSGLLLPQVASRYGWTPSRFLEGLGKKTGADPSDPRARLFAFEAQIFSRRGT
jgi:AmmeMemoRadiSam system protein A